MDTHYFESTGEAYDASQSREEIKDGDILVVLNEGVIGFLAAAWPVAVTEAVGHVHTADYVGSDDWPTYKESIDKGNELVKFYGLEERSLPEDSKAPLKKLQERYLSLVRESPDGVSREDALHILSEMLEL